MNTIDKKIMNEVKKSTVEGKSGKWILRRVPGALRKLYFLSSWSTPGTQKIKIPEHYGNTPENPFGKLSYDWCDALRIELFSQLKIMFLQGI